MFTLDDKSSIRVLVIEDETLLREFVCDYLEDTGYSTINAPNGRIGLERILKEKPDLVLTDLRMPEMNGLELLATLQVEAPETPVIVISGTGSLNDVVQTLKLGAWDYILKPISDVDILEVAINRVLERKWLLEENKRYREHLEEEVVKRTAELLKSTERFKTLFNLAGDSILIHDYEGTIINVNMKAIETLGYTEEEFFAMSMQKLIQVTDDNSIFKNINLLSKKTHIMFESEYINKNGSLIPMEISACNISIDNKLYVLQLCRNVSERKLIEEERKQLEFQIIDSQKMESVGLLASGIAHDFNNVLTSLTGYTHLLQRRMQEGSRELEYLENINGIINMGKKLARQITNFIRKDKNELVKVDIHKVLKESEALLRPNCHTVDIEVICKAQYFEIMGDESQLQNAFLNLGINARDAMPDGGKLSFITENGPDNRSRNVDYIKISVVDNGTGIPKEVVAKIFDPLFTTKEKGKGTGLGLTSVSYCIKNMQGLVEVESESGVGTTFKILLPINKGIAGADDLNSDGIKKKEILIIDNEDTICSALKEKLLAFGYSSKVQSSARHAIDWYGEHADEIGLVLLDYYLPVMNGYEVFQELKKINQNIRIAYMSSQKLPENIMVMDDNLIGFIQIPFNSEGFYNEITRILGMTESL
jgi:PAS domain S-box-containing protein